MRTSPDHRVEDGAPGRDGSGCPSRWLVTARTIVVGPTGRKRMGCHSLVADHDATMRLRPIFGRCGPFGAISGPGAYTRCPMKRPYRVVVAKPGLDGHDRGAKVIARAFRDAGFEVIYTGLHQTPEQVVQAVVQEDADAVGLSLLSGAHLTLVPRIIDGLRAQGLDDVLVIVGGIIPEGDIPVLKEQGVAAVFTPGAPLESIGTWLGEALDEREEAPAGS